MPSLESLTVKIRMHHNHYHHVIIINVITHHYQSGDLHCHCCILNCAQVLSIWPLNVATPLLDGSVCDLA